MHGHCMPMGKGEECGKSGTTGGRFPVVFAESEEHQENRVLLYCLVKVILGKYSKRQGVRRKIHPTHYIFPLLFITVYFLGLPS